MDFSEMKVKDAEEILQAMHSFHQYFLAVMFHQIACAEEDCSESIAEAVQEVVEPGFWDVARTVAWNEVKDSMVTAIETMEATKEELQI